MLLQVHGCINTVVVIESARIKDKKWKTNFFFVTLCLTHRPFYHYHLLEQTVNIMSFFVQSNNNLISMELPLNEPDDEVNRKAFTNYYFFKSVPHTHLETKMPFHRVLIA